MTDSIYNEPDWPSSPPQRVSKSPETLKRTFSITKYEGPTGDETELVVPAAFAAKLERKLNKCKKRLAKELKR